MNILRRLDSAIKAFNTIESSQSEIKEEVLANGQTLSDKKDIEDPTNKFAGIRHVRTVRQSTKSRNNVDFYKPEYDLPTLANAIQLDGLLRRIVNVFVEQIMKNGFESVSKNDKLQSHVNRRIKEIERLTGIALIETIENIAYQLVTYGNAYLIKVRSKNKSRYGKPYRLYGKDNNPIVGLFVAEATTMEIGLNPEGNVIEYKHVVRGTEDFYDERDVIHFVFNKIPGTLTGMSSLLPILDDVRALRKLEEEIEILGFQYSIPLYLYKVGNKDIPPAPGEVDEVSSTINSMPAYGMLVVPGHHSIDVPSNNNTPVDILSFVNHFKKRIYGGTGVSPVAMGEVETANRSTSEAVDATMQTVTKSYQRIIKSRIEIGLFDELMLDGNFTSITDDVEFNFQEIDLEQQIKKETNIIQKWQNNLISREEARNAMNYDKALDEKSTFLELVDIPKAKSTAIIKAKNSSKDTSKSNKAANSNKIAPANQYGKSSGRPKFVKNSIDQFIQDSMILVDCLSDSGSFTDFNSENLIEKTKNSFKSKAKVQILDNIKDITSEYKLDELEINLEAVDSYFNDVDAILVDKIRFFSKKTNDTSRSKILFDEISDFVDIQKLKLDSISKILIYKELGYKSIMVNSEICDDHKLINLDTNVLNYSHIPPFNYGCKCSIDTENLYEIR